MHDKPLTARARRRRARRIRRTALLALIALALLGGLAAAVLALLPGGEEADGEPLALTFLVNAERPLPEGYAPRLRALAGGQQVDGRVKKPLEHLLQDAESAGYTLTVAAAFRTAEKQQSLIDERIAAREAGGLTYEEAAAAVAREVQPVWSSEHQLGLAVDLNTAADRATSDEEYGWLADNAWRYGFILRYPADKEAVTGVSFEPWHYRYVGEQAAAAMHESGQCLEEYAQASIN